MLLCRRARIDHRTGVFHERSSAAGTPALTACSLWELFDRRRIAEPNRVFLHADGRAWTAAEVGERVDRAAAAFAATGIGQGDRVGLLLENGVDFVSSFFGVARLGAVAVTVNTALRGETLEYILSHAEVRLVVAEPAFVADGTAMSAPGIVWTPGDVESGPQEGIPPPRQRLPGDVAAIVYTSGTTGRPKGVMLTDHGYWRAASWFAESLRLTRDDVLYTCLPLFHVNAQHLSLCGALAAGAELVLGRKFSASRFWETIAESRATSFNLIGAMLGILHLQPVSGAEREHRARVACVAPVPPSIHRECEERFGTTLVDGYGLTETTPGIAYNLDGRLGSCGKQAPYVELAIVDEQGTPLAARVPGEIVVRPLEPAVLMAGYYRDPDATAAAFRNEWFRSGDRGYADEDGYLYFVDRLKDAIRRRGEMISPVEIERIAIQHEDVSEAVAFGVPSDIPGGEEEVALVVTAMIGTRLDLTDLVSFCRSRLPRFMMPRYYEIIDDFPRTETQRIQKAELRRRGVAGCLDVESRS